jgi:hypothetical protein
MEGKKEGKIFWKLLWGHTAKGDAFIWYRQKIWIMQNFKGISLWFLLFLIGVLEFLLAYIICTTEKGKYHMFSLICGIYFLKMNGRARCWWLMPIIFDTSGLRSGGVWLKSSPASSSWDLHVKNTNSKVPWTYGSRSKEPAFWVWSPEVTHQPHYKKRTTEMWGRFCLGWVPAGGGKVKVEYERCEYAQSTFYTWMKI